ncbi:MAG: sigma-54-dependent Fis family transcriptional regulator, partial [Pseudomonadota bacterium]
MHSRSRKYTTNHEMIHLPETFLRQINQEQELLPLLQLIEKEASQQLKAEGISVFLLDREEGELWFPLPVSGKVLRLDARLGVVGACASTGEVIRVNDAQTDSRFFPSIDVQIEQQTRTLLAVPLRDRTGEVFGVFEAVNKKGKEFSAQDEVVAQAIVDCISLPLQKFHFVEQLRCERERLKEENAHLRGEVEERFSTQNLIGTSLPMQQLVRVIDQIRDSSVDVLITGENGTGKELVAKAIHYSSPRARYPFVAINCAALPENLIESELFGIGRGTATGVDARIGKFEQAHKGTLFLDEIGDLGLKAQAKVLRVLQERVVEPVGERRAIPLSICVVAGTNTNLEEAIKKGTFREDLYYRLKVVHIQTPALREIPADIPLLANYFLDKYCKEMGKPRKKLASAAMRRLVEYDWPGNMRQLENEMKRLTVMVRAATISEGALDLTIKRAAQRANIPEDLERKSLPEILGELEEQIIKDTLMACQFNQVR